jgi:hypothetical protein
MGTKSMSTVRCTMDAEYADVSASTPAVVPGTMGEGHGLSALHSGHTESADVSASTPVVPEHYGHEEHVYRVLHHGHTEYADVSASTPAVVPGTMDTKSMSTVCCTMDTQSMLMSQLASGSSSGAL